ncbi:MAG: hypothetical protein IJ955_00510 [Oscillospiraceae bacterium]|nr:hypothetical protein [Oscillospiraceae bacterium]
MGAEMRAWRQTTGRLCQYLSREAKQVSRIFCGSTDLSLSEAGIEELKKLSYDIKNVRFLTSGMKPMRSILHTHSERTAKSPSKSVKR